MPCGSPGLSDLLQKERKENGAGLWPRYKKKRRKKGILYILMSEV